ncbi:rCG37342 [Rattus norvegicus]|uniref:RCG37342 n=1 Tax=Rattus norvegicus TaxID=10116 RepID=A6KHQ3_RAT|nr:rCG37342 [Rattus norvegicus]
MRSPLLRMSLTLKTFLPRQGRERRGIFPDYIRAG